MGRSYTRPESVLRTRGGAGIPVESSDADRNGNDSGGGWRAIAIAASWLAALAAAISALVLLVPWHHRSETSTVLSRSPTTSRIVTVAASPARQVPTMATRSSTADLHGVSLPVLAPGNTPVAPVRLLLILSPSIGEQLTKGGQLAALASWMQTNENPASHTRVLVTDSGPRGRLTPDRASSMAGSLSGSRTVRRGTATRWLLAPIEPGSSRLAVEIGSGGPPETLGGAPLRRIAMSANAPVPSLGAVDLRRRDALAAAVALLVAKASSQRVAVAPAILQ